MHRTDLLSSITDARANKAILHEPPKTRVLPRVHQRIKGIDERVKAHSILLVTKAESPFRLKFNGKDETSGAETAERRLEEI